MSGVARGSVCGAGVTASGGKVVGVAEDLCSKKSLRKAPFPHPTLALIHRSEVPLHHVAPLHRLNECGAHRRELALGERHAPVLKDWAG